MKCFIEFLYSFGVINASFVVVNYDLASNHCADFASYHVSSLKFVVPKSHRSKILFYILVMTSKMYYEQVSRS